MSQLSVRSAASAAGSVRDSVSPAEWQARVDLAAAHRFLALKGLQDDHSLYNHLSVRIPDDLGFFLMKPHDLLFREVTASNLKKISVDGPAVGFNHNVNPAGHAIHGGVMQARADVHSVMHIHTVPGTAVGALESGLICLTQESMQFYNRIGYHAFEGVAEIDERETIIRDLGQHNALFLRNHGVLTSGRSVIEALKRLFQLVRACEVQLMAQASGQKIVQPAPEVCEHTATLFNNRPVKAHEQDWLAMLRWIDLHDTSYRD